MLHRTTTNTTNTNTNTTTTYAPTTTNTTNTTSTTNTNTSERGAEIPAYLVRHNAHIRDLDEKVGECGTTRTSATSTRRCVCAAQRAHPRPGQRRVCKLCVSCVRDVL